MCSSDLGHQDYFLAPLPRSIALFISSPGSFSIYCNLLFIMKGNRNPKFPILPSTTRKGTALNSKATLDSPTVLSQLVTPPTNTRPTVDASLTESATASDEIDGAGSLGPFLESLCH